MRYQNFFQPWKLVTLGIGIAIMIIGSFVEKISDWDVGISLIMCTLTYLTAPFVCRTILRRDWKMFPLAAFLAWFTIDGCYVLYHTLAGNVMLREANAYASTPLYFFMGMVWLWNGSLRELASAIVASVRRPNRPNE
jgi:hypothetical protein